MPMQPVIINADDYAMDAEVDRAILRLGERGRVTATSAMTLSPRWPEAARALHDCPVSAGLHLDFTSEFADRSFSRQRLPALILRAHAGLLHEPALRAAIEKQLTLFESCMKKAPTFVDGHQHVHHLPAIRHVLMKALAHRYGAEARQIGLRICAPKSHRGVKAAIIARTGAFDLARLGREIGHPMNSDFAGVYAFGPKSDLRKHWEGWLRTLKGSLPIVMTHVALRSDGASGSDPIRAARYQEQDWLASEECESLLQRLCVNPVRWLPA